MALSKYDSTRETTNIARIVRIILGPCTDVLRAILNKEITPSVLPQKLRTFLGNLQKTKKPPISRDQESIVYNNGGNYSTFDITLLYFLLRNVCSIPEHRLKWGNEPSPTDRSVSANIERIRLTRNDYYGHATHFAILDQDFTKRWDNLFLIVKELEAYIGSSTDYQDALKELKSCSMDPEMEQSYIERLTVVKELQVKMKKQEGKYSLF